MDWRAYYKEHTMTPEQAVGVIHDGDRVVIRRQDSAEYGQAVVALIGDDATIKTFRPEKGRIILHPENPRLKDIIVAPEECRVLGLVVGCVHKFVV